jgi:hypothetical protein
MLISILVLELLYVRLEGYFCWFVRSFMWFCQVYYLARFGSDGAADVLPQPPLPHRAVVGLAGPRLRLNPPLVLTMAASSSTRWFR